MAHPTGEAKQKWLAGFIAQNKARAKGRREVDWKCGDSLYCRVQRPSVHHLLSLAPFLADSEDWQR